MNDSETYKLSAIALALAEIEYGRKPTDLCLGLPDNSDEINSKCWKKAVKMLAHMEQNGFTVKQK